MKATRPIAIFDIDGTIFRSSLLIEVTNVLIEQGTFPESASHGYAQEYRAWRERRGSYDDYLMKVVEVFCKHLQNIPPVALDQAAETVIRGGGEETYRFTRDLIHSLRPDHTLIAISLSPSQLVKRFAEHYGFDHYHATNYEIIDNRFTGQNDVTHRAKSEILDEIVRTNGLSLASSLAVGDSDSDISMLEAVDKPIAFNPNSTLFVEAAKRGWQIVVERKDVIYYYNAEGTRTNHD